MVPDTRFLRERLGAARTPGAPLQRLTRQSAEPIRVVIGESLEGTRDSLCALLQTQPDLLVLDIAQDGVRAVAAAQELQPDVLLLDDAAPIDGFAVLRQLRGLNTPTRTLLLTQTVDPSSVLAALRDGARGVLLKNVSAALLFRSIRRVHAGDVWIERAMANEIVAALFAPGEPKVPRARDFGLTVRERQVLALILEGHTNKAIATRLAIGPDAVKHHLSSIFDKTGASTRLELAIFALHHGVIGHEA